MIKPLQFLRLIALLGIVIGHAGGHFVAGGVEFCSFFFILSGFLYKGNKTTYWEYVWRKAKAIYPIYWICLVMSILLAYVRHNAEQSHIDWDIIPHLLLIQSWIPSTTNYAMNYLGLSWFLSSLMFCYLLSPLLYKVISRGKWNIVIIAFGLVLYKNVYALWGEYDDWSGYVSPILRAIEYGLGISLNLAIRDINKKDRTYINAFIGMSAVIIWILVLNYNISGSYYWVAHLFVISILYIFPSCMLDNLIGNNLILNVARQDMWIYLTHSSIGFHLMFFFVSTNAWIAGLGSVIIAVVMGNVYEFVRSKI